MSFEETSKMLGDILFNVVTYGGGAFIAYRFFRSRQKRKKEKKGLQKD